MQISRNAGTGPRAVAGRKAVTAKAFVPYGPAVVIRTRVRTAAPSIMTTSGPSGAKVTRGFSAAAGRTPYSFERNHESVSARSAAERGTSCPQRANVTPTAHAAQSLFISISLSRLFRCRTEDGEDLPAAEVRDPD